VKLAAGAILPPVLFTSGFDILHSPIETSRDQPFTESPIQSR
jgi:hypothetical protein